MLLLALVTSTRRVLLFLVSSVRRLQRFASLHSLQFSPIFRSFRIALLRCFLEQVSLYTFLLYLDYCFRFLLLDSL